MFLKNPIKGCQNEQCFFKRPKIMVFEILTFDFLSRGKKDTINYCLYECNHIVMKN